jgi:hypothetical protein
MMNFSHISVLKAFWVIKPRMRWAGHVARMEEKRGAYRILVGRPEGRRPLGRPSIDGRIIFKWIFKKWDGGMNWIELAQDRGRRRALVNAVMNLRVPQNAGNFLAS